MGAMLDSKYFSLGMGWLFGRYLKAVAARGGVDALVGGGHQLELGLGLDGRADLDGRGQREDGCA